MSNLLEKLASVLPANNENEFEPEGTDNELAMTIEALATLFAEDLEEFGAPSND